MARTDKMVVISMAIEYSIYPVASHVLNEYTSKQKIGFKIWWDKNIYNFKISY